MNLILILIYIILIIICIYLIYNILKLLNILKTKNISSNQNTFINKSDDIGILKNYMINIINNSIFFYRMNALDLIARNVKTYKDYIDLYINNLSYFSANETNILKNLINKIDKLSSVKKTKYYKNIPWKFIKQSNDIENGWPHTLGDVIILSNNFFELNEKDQILILIHEKIHIYQRLYPIETHKLIHDYLGFDVTNKIENILNARNNPDINNFIYKKENIVLVQLYDSLHPKNINDSSVYNLNKQIKITTDDLKLPKIIKQYEHPFEIMACILPEIIVNNYNNNSNFINQINIWYDKYF